MNSGGNVWGREVYLHYIRLCLHRENKQLFGGERKLCEKREASACVTAAERNSLEFIIVQNSSPQCCFWYIAKWLLECILVGCLIALVKRSFIHVSMIFLSFNMAEVVYVCYPGSLIP